MDGKVPLENIMRAHGLPGKTIAAMGVTVYQEIRPLHYVVFDMSGPVLSYADLYIDKKDAARILKGTIKKPVKKPKAEVLDLRKDMNKGKHPGYHPSRFPYNSRK